MKTALTLFLLLMTTTGCALPLKLLQALLPAPKPVPDVTPYPKTILRDIVPGQKIDWIGNDTVVFVGWGVRNQPGSSIYAWDQLNPPQIVRKGAFNFCVNENSIMLSVREQNAQSAKSYRIPFPSRKTEYLGTKDLTHGFSYFSNYTCESKPVPPPLARHNWEELRPGEGFLDLGVDDIHHNFKVTYLDASLQNRKDTGIRVDLPILSEITDWHPQPGYLLYDINLSPEERKRWQKTNRLTLWHLDADHQGHVVNVPAGPWVNIRRGDILFLKARSGLVITTAGFEQDGSPGTAGAYLVQTDGYYERLETGFVSEPALSADGCKLAYAFEEHLNQHPRPREGGRILVVVNLCTKQASR
ncbi:MAG: hypothetical protein WCH37_05235 [Synechococcaceae cyanobacterium ELA182]